MSVVSVVIPTYNRSETIERALNSVLSQTYSNYEVLVCDDCSTDKTFEIVNKYAELDSRIKWIPSDCNEGPAAARNRGMLQAIGKYIAFLDSDDEWLPNKLQVQVDLMNSVSSDVGVSFVGAKIIKSVNSSSQVTIYQPKKEWEINSLEKLLLKDLKFLTPAVMIRRDVIHDVGLMNENMICHEDVDFLFRVFKKYSLIISQELLCIIYMNISPIDKQAYNKLCSVLKYKLSHVKYIESRFGIKCSKKYQSDCYMSIVDAAIREGRWMSALSLIKKKMSIIAVFDISDLLLIVKSVLVRFVSKNVL